METQRGYLRGRRAFSTGSERGQLRPTPCNGADPQAPLCLELVPWSP